MVRQLRSYIAPAAPATRAPCDGTESPMRIEFGFTPKWYRDALGIDFSERWHTDPAYRAGALAMMRGELNRRFPALGLGGPEPGAARATLDGVHGALIVAQLFGIPCDYYPDNWPAARHAYLDRDTLARMEPPDLSDSPVMEAIFRQMDAIAAAHGRIEGYLNWQGVLNNAFRIRGPEIFADLMADPPFARHCFHLMAETMIAGMRLVYARQRISGVMVEHATVSNCVVNMISPDAYAEHLLPFDRQIAEAFPAFGVHNCAWNADGYLPHYATLPKLGYVDMGLDSDLRRARRLCPEARRAVMYKPTDLANKSLAELEADLARIRREFSPCDIVMADIESGTPDTRILEFAGLAEAALAIEPDTEGNE